MLREKRRKCPSFTAAVCCDVRLTYAELDERVNRVANALAGLGVGAGDSVAWIGQNCHRVLEVLLACGRLGAFLVPANWRQCPEEMAAVLDDLSPRVVLWQEVEVGPNARVTRSLTIAPARWV